MRKVLELPAFRRLLAAAVFNEIAVSVGAVALALLVYRRTGSALGAMVFFLCAEFGPAFFSPLFVSRLDQRSAAGALGALYATESVIFLILAWLVGHFQVVILLGLVLLDGSLAVAARVLSRSAWTATTSPAGRLREANALVNSSLSVCYMIGPALGGAIVAAGGTRAALLVNVGVFAVMAITIATARGLPKGAPQRAPSAGRLRAAFVRAWGERELRRLLLLQSLGMVFFTISIPVEVVFARHDLHAGAGGYGALLAAWGAGTIFGSGLYARWRALSSRVLITFGTLLIGLGLLVMAIAPGLGVAIAGAAVGGTGNGVQIVAMRTALQEEVPEQFMALILSLNESIFQAIPGVGIVLGGAIAELAGARVGLAVASGGALVVALVVWSRLAAGPGRIGRKPPQLESSEAELTTATGKR